MLVMWNHYISPSDSEELALLGRQDIPRETKIQNLRALTKSRNFVENPTLVTRNVTGFNNRATHFFVNYLYKSKQILN